MALHSPNVATPPDVIARLITLLDEWGVQTFVDAGCGDGNVLIAAARANAERTCIGIEIDPEIAARTQARAAALKLTNVKVIAGDIRRTSSIATADCVFCYVGGALHQALGASLVHARSSARLVTALYPVAGLPLMGKDTTASLALYFYAPGQAHQHVLWDSAVSVSIAYEGGAQLTCRAAIVYGTGPLSATIIAPEPAIQQWLSVSLGTHSVLPGQTVVCDIVLRPPIGQANYSSIPVKLVLHCGSHELTPAHYLIVGASREQAIDACSPWPSLDEQAAIELAQRLPDKLTHLVKSLDSSRPAV